MSAVASFYVIPSEKVGRLKEAAVAGGRPGGVDDRFWDFLFAEASELQAFPWSGYVLSDLLGLLQEEGLRYEEFHAPELTSFLCGARGSTKIVFEHERALAFARRLRSFDLAPGRLSEYAREEVGEADAEAYAHALRDARRILLEWLESVPPGAVALLSIG
jgi:hypothetical protein